MLLSQHAIIGAAISVATGNPVAGFFGALASHHILDMVPHIDGAIVKKERRFHEREDENWPRSTYILAYCDSTLTLLLILILAVKTNMWELIMLGAFGGSLPDLLDNVPWWKDWFRQTWIGKRWHNLHEIMHYHWRGANIFSIILAIAFQIFLTVGGVIWVLSRS